MGKTRGNLNGGGAKIVTGTGHPGTAVVLGFEPDFVSVVDSYTYNDRIYNYSSTAYKDYTSYNIKGTKNYPVGGGTISTSWSNSSLITINSTGFSVSTAAGTGSASYQYAYIAGKY